MKIARIIGLTAIAALAVMAFVGAGSASATVLCSQPPEEGTELCPAGSTLPSGTTFKASLETGTKLTLWSYQSCSGSQFSGESTAASGEPLPAFGTFPTLSSCTWGCKITWPEKVNQQFSHTEAGDGNLTLRAGSEGPPRYRQECSFPAQFTCEWQAANLGEEELPGAEYAVEGGSPARLIASNQIYNRIYAFGSTNWCPQELSISGAYTVTSPTSLYLAAE